MNINEKQKLIKLRKRHLMVWSLSCRQTSWSFPYSCGYQISAVYKRHIQQTTCFLFLLFSWSQLRTKTGDGRRKNQFQHFCVFTFSMHNCKVRFFENRHPKDPIELVFKLYDRRNFVNRDLKEKKLLNDFFISNYICFK